MGFGSGGGSEFSSGRNDLDGDLTVSGDVTIDGIASGSIAGSGSYLAINTDNKVVLSLIDAGGSAAITSYTNAADNRIVTSVDSSTVNGEANLTFDGSILTVTGDVSATGDITLNDAGTDNTAIRGSLGVSGSTTLGDASGDSVTVVAQTITLSNVAAGTDNTVLVYDGSSIVTDEIDSKVWDGNLIDVSGTPSDNQLATWTDADTVQGESNLTFDGSILTVTGDVSATGDVTLGNASSDNASAAGNFGVSGSFDLSGSSKLGGTESTDKHRITGSVYLKNTLSVDDNVTFSGDSNTVAALTASNGVQFIDSAVYIQSPSDGNLTIAADGTMALKSDTITLGTGGDTDIALNFDANSNDGAVKWFEDEESFQLANRVTIGVAPTTLTLHKGELSTLASMDSASAKYTTQYDANFTLGGDVVSIGNSSTTQGGLYYLDYSGGWEGAHASLSKAAKNMIGIAIGSNSSTHGIFIKGLIRIPAGSIDGEIGNAGAPLYLTSGSAGKMHFTSSALVGQFIRTLGYCVDRNGTTDILLYFDPAGEFSSIL